MPVNPSHRTPDHHAIEIRRAAPDDFAAICALNAAEVQHTSPMDLSRLTFLDSLSAHHKVACVDGVVGAFLLAMGSEAAYENENFGWFRARLTRFLYVDRIVVSAAVRSHHLGTRLYEDLFAHARAAGYPWVTCEYNIIPPNEPSRRFHERFGFTEQGTQWVANGAKKVSLQAAPSQPAG
jgi:predicted GNAT superfamily acetyltransferase